MFIIILDTNDIYTYDLNSKIEYKGISIYSKNNNYYIDLKSGLFFCDNTKSKILECKCYEINRNDSYCPIYIYVYTSSQGINDFKLYKNTNFVIANDNRANIVSSDPYLKDYYLSFKNNTLTSNFNVIVNHHKYNDELLKDGDVINYLGIKIIYFSEFLYINNFNNTVKIQEYDINQIILKYNDVIKLDNYYIPEDIKSFKLDELKDYISPKKPNNIDFIKSIMPNLIMCISMGIMAYLNYMNNSNNGSVIQYIVMPVSMLISSILLPIIFIISNNIKYKKEVSLSIDEYSLYLNDYENKLIESINDYISSLNSRFFNLFDSKKRMFYASNNSDEFLKISLGKIYYTNDLKLKRYGIEIIDNKLKQIEDLANNIDDYPLYLDIKQNRRITVVSKSKDKLNIFYRYLLELSYKHHYDDLKIGVYSKDNSLFDSFYNLPHLFLDKNRLTLNTYKDIQEINQLKLDKPLVILLFDKCDYYFNNENIYTIYFSKNISDLLKDSDCIVEYINNNAYLYSNNKQEFRYIPEDIKYTDYFSYIGKYLLLENTFKTYKFQDVFIDTISNNYKNNDHLLKANFAYDNNELIQFDLHESKQGPHGLIGGSTGSGKSEFIVSMLLSLCIIYSPEYLNIVLIDYKGGGIKESLSYNGQTLPHIVASLTNLQDYALERLIIALKNECKNRQALFKKLSDISNTSIMNIDDYIECNDIYKLSSIAHLIIVVDEFAELKKESPEQIKELISISRIGRSLGLHLILATQKPAGVIDDEIWSNSRFKIALKVFDEKDSMDIIKRKDAAYLKQAGSFYMLVDSSLNKGQAIYSKSDIYGKDPYVVSILDNKLNKLKSYKKQDNQIYSCASYYTKQIIDTAKRRRLNISPINYLPPNSLSINKLSNKQCIIMGQVDDYINNKFDLLTYHYKSSLLIYSSRKCEINNILYFLNKNDRRSVVIGSREYEGTFISDSLIYDNNEDIEYLFKNLLLNKNNNITLVIEDLYCLLSYDEIYLDYLLKLIKRKDSLAISLILITSNSQISFKLINSIKNKILINVDDMSDLSTFFGCRSKYKGNSFFYQDEPISFVPCNIIGYVPSRRMVPNFVKHIPDVITPIIVNNKYLLGYFEESKEPLYMNENIIVVSYSEDLLNQYRNAYPNIKTQIYTNSFNPENYFVLWLGPGIFNQRLCVVGLNNDIEDSQALLIKNNRCVLVRSLYNASKINEI